MHSHPHPLPTHWTTQGVNTPTYAAIKRWSHTVSGIPTQCVQAGKALQTRVSGRGHLADDPQYYAGIMHKVNLKLGGINVCAVRGGSALKLVRDSSMPTMVVGIDVNHAAPGSPNPSFAAVVGSVDEECASYHSIVEEQRDAKKEPIEHLEEKIHDLLKAFSARHECRGVQMPSKLHASKHLKLSDPTSQKTCVEMP